VHRFLLRVSDELWERLISEARAAQISVNVLICSMLEVDLETDEEVARAVAESPLRSYGGAVKELRRELEALPEVNPDECPTPWLHRFGKCPNCGEE
jgi:hypothetical protein